MEVRPTFIQRFKNNLISHRVNRMNYEAFRYANMYSQHSDQLFWQKKDPADIQATSYITDNITIQDQLTSSGWHIMGSADRVEITILDHRHHLVHLFRIQLSTHSDFYTENQE